jgi:hypothetical protein
MGQNQSGDPERRPRAETQSGDPERRPRAETLSPGPSFLSLARGSGGEWILLLGNDRVQSGFCGVELDKALPLFRHIHVGKNRFHRALGDAEGAVNAHFRVDIECFLRLVKALNGANLNTVRVLAVYARLANHMGHGG